MARPLLLPQAAFIEAGVEAHDKLIVHLQGGGAQVAAWPHHMLEDFGSVIALRIPVLYLVPLGRGDPLGVFEKSPCLFAANFDRPCVNNRYGGQPFGVKNLLRIGT